MYVAVKGGEKAIDNAHALLAEGFAALRAARYPAEATREALDAQRGLVRRLFGAATAGSAPPSY